MLGVVSNLRGFRVSEYVKRLSYRGLIIPEDVRWAVVNADNAINYKEPRMDVSNRRDMPELSPLEMLTPQLRPLEILTPSFNIWDKAEIEDLWNDIFINARTKIKKERSGYKRLVFVIKEDGKERQIAAGKVVWNCMNLDDLVQDKEKVYYYDGNPFNNCPENLFKR